MTVKELVGHLLKSHQMSEVSVSVNGDNLKLASMVEVKSTRFDESSLHGDLILIAETREG